MPISKSKMSENEEQIQTQPGNSTENKPSDVVVLKIPGSESQSDEERVFCRLCYGTKYDDGNLIEPCLCKGSVAKVHRKCLEKWLNRIGSKTCELCLFEFKCEETLRYGLCESIQVWLRQYRQHRYLLHDLCLFVTMNIITMSMIVVLLQAIYQILSNEAIRNALPMWYILALWIAAILWIAIYLLTVAVFFNTQIRPWYQWWRSTKKIKIVNV